MVQNKKLTYYLGFFALFYVLTVAIGIFNNYSPVPFWDMWNGYLDFYVKFMDGDWKLIYSQHNEHRIIFSRILFWIDNYFFNGTILFLLIVNFILMATIAFMLIKIQNELISDKFYSNILNFITIIFLFSWIQEENITWGFQSQFFVAYLFPLLSFYFLVKSSINNNLAFFVYGLIFGILSIGTMGNGVLALPILILLAFLIKVEYIKIFFLVSVGGIFIYLHLTTYIQPPYHSSFSEGLVNNQILFMQYLLTYLGSPFYYMLGNSYLVAQFFGALLIFGSLFFTYKFFLSKDKHNIMVLVLLAIILYIGGTAFGTAGGRCTAGLGGALSSRYMTPTIILWISFFTLSFYFLKNKYVLKTLVVFFLLVPLLLLKSQLHVFKDNEHKLYEFKLASLAAELQVRDEDYLKKVFPFIDWLMQMIPIGSNKNISMFGNEIIKDLKENIGHKKIDISQYSPVNGYIDRFEFIPSDSDYYRIVGWYADDKNRSSDIQRLTVIDHNKIVIGYLLQGTERKDVVEALKIQNTKTGFAGYLKTSGNYSTIYLVDENNKTFFEVNAQSLMQKKPPFEIESNFKQKELVDSKKILENHFQKNALYDYEAIDGVEFYGSYIKGDIHKGCISSIVNKDESLVIITGPIISSQIIQIFDKNKTTLYNGFLPKYEKLISLYFNDVNLPNSFIVEICDNGQSWGEWCGVGFKGEKINESK